jgi:hypothetical protein
MAVNVQLATDCANECFAHIHLFYHRQLETERSGASSPWLNPGVSAPRF